MTTTTTIACWRKSSRSTQGGNCVEIDGNLSAVRDSKNATGPVIRGSVPALVAAIRTGQITR